MPHFCGTKTEASPRPVRDEGGWRECPVNLCKQIGYTLSLNTCPEAEGRTGSCAPEGRAR